MEETKRVQRSMEHTSCGRGNGSWNHLAMNAKLSKAFHVTKILITIVQEKRHSPTDTLIQFKKFTPPLNSGSTSLLGCIYSVGLPDACMRGHSKISSLAVGVRIKDVKFTSLQLIQSLFKVFSLSAYIVWLSSINQ